MKGYTYWILAGLMVTACLCLAAPEPAIVPGPNDWTVDVSFEHPKHLVLKPSRGDKPERFWYVVITLTNAANRDADFYPKCELVTDTFQIIPAGTAVPPLAFEQIKKRHKSKYPLLELLEDAGDKILQGRDNAKDIAIIWPDFDPKAKGIKLFITGLSNETVAVDHPAVKDETGKPLRVFLRKTLELSYKLGGDPTFRSDTRLIFESKRWVMR